MNLSKNSWLLIAITSIHSVIELFLNTFLVSYFLNLTNNNIVPTAIFYIFTYLIPLWGFALIGPFVKNGKKIKVYRTSFILSALSLLLIIHLKESVTDYIWFLGIVIGIEKVLFYFPQNLLTSEIAKGGQVVKFNGYQMAITGFLRIIAPIVLGWFITMDSFINTAVFVLALTILEFILSNMLTKIKSVSKPFNIKALFVLALKRKKIKISMGIEVFRGITFDILDTLIVLYIIYMFKTDFKLGILTSIFAICSVIANALLGRFCKITSFGSLLIVCSLLSFLGTVYFVFNTSEFSFIVYNLVFASAAQLIRTVTTINMYKVSQSKSVASTYRAEYLALREFFLNLGRIIGFGLVIWAAVCQDANMLKYLILMLSILIIVVGYMSVILSHWISETENKC